jgi:hypothetical protein
VAYDAGVLVRRDLLVSDAERDSVADFLQAHYTAGRLTHDELGARIDATYGSRWRSQLLDLTRDLPPVPPPAAPPRRRTPRLVVAATLVLTVVVLAALVSGLPDELQLLLVVLVVPMLVALAVIVVPFVLLIAMIRWAVDKLAGSTRALTPPARPR